MHLRPDIVVTRADTSEVLLVVNVNANVTNLTSADTALKSYMVHVGCPVGMFVNPDQVHFYRNRYTDYAADSVEMIGECLIGDLLGAFSAGDLQRSVGEWLDGLQDGDDRSWPAAVREAIESSVLPVVNSGVVRAGGPRWRRAG